MLAIVGAIHALLIPFVILGIGIIWGKGQNVGVTSFITLALHILTVAAIYCR